MKLRRLSIVVVVAILIILAILYLWGPGAVPAGQQPLVTLSNANFAEFENTFDAAPNAPRILFLMSPT